MVFYLYHYTNSSAADDIEKNKIIRVPTSKKGWFGRGIYLTSLPPSSGRKAILLNNYRKKSEEIPRHWFKTAVYFRFSQVYLPTVEKLDSKDGRDLYVYRQDINLLNTPYIRGLTEDSAKMNSRGGGEIHSLPSGSGMANRPAKINSRGGGEIHQRPLPSGSGMANPPAVVNVVNYILPADTGRHWNTLEDTRTHWNTQVDTGRHWNHQRYETYDHAPIDYQTNEDDETNHDECCIIL